MKRTRHLEDLLDEWAVHAPGMWENDVGPKGWWAVSSANSGIVAYFADEDDACRFRLAEINRALNG